MISIFDAANLLTGTVAAPGLLFLLIAAGWLLGWEPRERTLARLTAGMYLAMCVALLATFVQMKLSGANTVSSHPGDWFVSGAYRFPLILAADRLSLPLLALTAVLTGLVGSFSVRYLHRDRGFIRFFLLLYLFSFGALLAFAAGSFDLLIGGWELVGLSSVLLIAFFQERREPVRNGLRVFAFYRVADLGLLTGVLVLHHALGSTVHGTIFRGEWPSQTTGADGATATAIGMLFLLAACGKSAQIPFCSWLPRAMEGPTPSSAIFYGAISVHMGAYLLLRAMPFIAASPLATGATIAVGLLTALLGTLSHRAATDAKTSLAFASMTQVGIVFVEIGLGLPWLAVLHIVGHAAVRTMQFLRAPSMLHDYHRMHAAAGGHLASTGKHLEEMLPRPAQLWLYRFALERGSLDVFIDRFIAGPVVKLSQLLIALEPRHDPVKTAPPPRESTKQVARKIDA